ncbi:MAG: hypothetical protein WBA91_07710 [Paracoccaceae bacterium]
MNKAKGPHGAGPGFDGDAEAEALLALARQGALPPADLMARVMAEASALQPAPVRDRPAKAGPAATYWSGRGFRRWLGGWLGSVRNPFAGAVAAGVAGLAIGYLQPFDLITSAEAASDLAIHSYFDDETGLLAGVWADG